MEIGKSLSRVLQHIVNLDRPDGYRPSTHAAARKEKGDRREENKKTDETSEAMRKRTPCPSRRIAT
jgi:hypothetical protein